MKFDILVERENIQKENANVYINLFKNSNIGVKDYCNNTSTKLLRKQ